MGGGQKIDQRRQRESGSLQLAHKALARLRIFMYVATVTSLQTAMESTLIDLNKKHT